MSSKQWWAAFVAGFVSERTLLFVAGFVACPALFFVQPLVGLVALIAAVSVATATNDGRGRLGGPIGTYSDVTKSYSNTGYQTDIEPSMVGTVAAGYSTAGAVCFVAFMFMMAASR